MDNKAQATSLQDKPTINKVLVNKMAAIVSLVSNNRVKGQGFSFVITELIQCTDGFKYTEQSPLNRVKFCFFLEKLRKLS